MTKPVSKKIEIKGTIEIANSDIDTNVEENCHKATTDLFSLLRSLEILSEAENNLSEDKEEEKEKLSEVKGILIGFANSYTQAIIDDASDKN